jgi:phosphoglycerate dehydrogenase-like enzyme
MRFWVPSKQVALALADVPGITVQVAATDEGELPPGADEVEFYVPPLFASQPALAAMRQMPRLRVVQTVTAGVEALLPHIPPGVTLCNARGVHDAGTAEWVVAAMLAAVREFRHFAAEQAARRWSYRFTDSLAGKTVLIVGYGSIGRAVERRLAGFEVDVRRVARSPRDGVEPVSRLPELLPEADVVVVLAPVTEETIGMVDAGFLALMKDGALLVNAARGVIVDTGALLAELNAGRLRAALDVTDPEPLPADHPLLRAPNLLVVPHVGSATVRTRHRMTEIAVDNLLAALAGEPMPHQAN